MPFVFRIHWVKIIFKTVKSVIFHNLIYRWTLRNFKTKILPALEFIITLKLLSEICKNHFLVTKELLRLLILVVVVISLGMKRRFYGIFQDVQKGHIKRITPKLNRFYDIKISLTA